MNKEQSIHRLFSQIIKERVEEERSSRYEAVSDPFMTGHITIFKLKKNERRELTNDEERYRNLPIIKKMGMRYFWRWLGF